MEHNFSFGIEEEYFLVDAETSRHAHFSRPRSAPRSAPATAR
jgi:hypothetical protein